jgi:hypothetical protein
MRKIPIVKAERESETPISLAAKGPMVYIRGR